MSNLLPDEILNHLVSVSEAMVNAASESRWDDLASLDEDRRQGLEQLSENGRAFDPGRFLLACQSLSQLDQQLLQIVREARNGAAEAHKNLKKNRNGVSHYQQAERPAA